MPPASEQEYSNRKITDKELYNMHEKITSITKDVDLLGNKVSGLMECKDNVSGRLTEATGRLDKNTIEIVSLKEELERTSEALQKTNENLKEILEVWNNGKGFVKTSKTFSKFLVWASITIAATSGVIAAILKIIRE